MYCSETLALIKDTDKEDREKALKASWEAEEPGRAEKAALSRRKFILKQKQKRGEELTEEELEVLNERRERIRKKEQEEAATAKGGGKGGKAPAAKGKGDKKEAKGGAPAQEDETDGPKVVYPQAEEHFNDDITRFLEHFSSARKIVETLDGKEKARKRDDEEKSKILEDFESARTAETEAFDQIAAEREAMKETRQSEREEAFKDTDGARDEYKVEVASLMDDRNKYRDMIEGRKIKEG